MYYHACLVVKLSRVCLLLYTLYSSFFLPCIGEWRCSKGGIVGTLINDGAAVTRDEDVKM